MLQFSYVDKPIKTSFHSLFYTKSFTNKFVSKCPKTRINRGLPTDIKQAAIHGVLLGTYWPSCLSNLPTLLTRKRPEEVYFCRDENG